MAYNEFDKGVDYKTMYFKLARALDDATQILITAMQECEILYIDAGDEKRENRLKRLAAEILERTGGPVTPEAVEELRQKLMEYLCG